MRRPLADQAAEYARAWATFEQLEQVAPHRADWARWADGRGPHTLFMVLVREPAVVEAIAAVQARLHGIRGLELHSRHFLHVSIQTCGFAHELVIDGRKIEQALANLPPFDLQLGGLNAFHSAVFLETHSGGGLQRLRTALRRALPPELARVDPFESFLFHLTIGYLSEEADPAELRARMRELRGHCTARLRVESVHLVELPTDQREAFPSVEPVRSFALAGR